MPPVEIQWCDHSSVLLEYLRQLYEEGRFVDVGLECEGKQVKAHKAVISACSPYLEGLLKGNPARSHLIKFNGYSYNSLRAVIDFMYNGKVMIEQDNLAAFLKLGRALQVRGILDIAQQCEDAGLTTPEETKSNAQYSTTLQQRQKQTQRSQPATSSDNKKYAYLMDKGTTQKKTTTAGGAGRRPNVVDVANKVTGIGAAHVAQQQAQKQEQFQQQQLETSDGQQEVTPTTLEELQQAFASGQAFIQTTETSGGEQTVQMVEGQCVVTGSGQTYVVVQEGDNISFVPAEMVQGDLQAAVNGGQVMEGLDSVEQQLAQMEGQAIDQDGNAVQQTSGGGDAGTLDTMSVVESLVKLGEKQPNQTENGGVSEQTEVGADMPDLEGDGEDEGDMEERKGLKRKGMDSVSSGKGKKLKN